MNTTNGDQHLREAFARLSREVALLVPEAESFVGRARAPRRRTVAPRFVPGLALASLLAVLVIVAVRSARRADERVTVARRAFLLRDGLWRAPTDFLLEVPGAALLRTTPSFDTNLPTWRSARGAIT